MKMRVLHVNYEYPDVTSNCGGGGRVTELLHDRLGDLGHSTHVFTDQADGHWATFPVRSYRDLRDRIQMYRPDVVHGHFSLPSSLLLPRVSRREGIPFVVSVMGADVYDPTRFDPIRPIADRANARIFNAADRVVAPSSDMAHRVASRWSVTPETIRYGIDTGSWEWRERSTNDTPTVLSVCRLVDRKNLNIGIEAVRGWRSRSELDVQYQIVGTGPLADELQSTPDWVTLLGYVENLQSVFDTADLFFLPSYHEAFGIAILEALATGLPAVTSSHGGQTDVVTEDVGRTAPATPSACAEALSVVWSDYQNLQRNTQGYVDEHFSADRMGREYADLYSEVAG